MRTSDFARAWEVQKQAEMDRDDAPERDGLADACTRARQVALADADFLALRAAYWSGAEGWRTLSGLIRDRLLDLGIEGEPADDLMETIWYAHPANDVPF
jgi:hypothetical protein